MGDKISRSVRKIYFGIISDHINRKTVFSTNFWSEGNLYDGKFIESELINNKVRFQITSYKWDITDFDEIFNPFYYELKISVVNKKTFDIAINLLHPVMYFKIFRLFRLSKKSKVHKEISNGDAILMDAIPITYKRKLKLKSLK